MLLLNVNILNLNGVLMLISCLNSMLTKCSDHSKQNWACTIEIDSFQRELLAGCPESLLLYPSYTSWTRDFIVFNQTTDKATLTLTIHDFSYEILIENSYTFVIVGLCWASICAVCLNTKLETWKFGQEPLGASCAGIMGLCWDSRKTMMQLTSSIRKRVYCKPKPL